MSEIDTRLPAATLAEPPAEAVRDGGPAHRRSWFRIGAALAGGALLCATIVALVVPPSLTDPSGIGGGVLANYTLPAGVDIHTDGSTSVEFTKVTFAPGSTGGWHAHNGYLLVSVASGTATFYDADDPTCTPHRYSAGQGLVESPHHVHITRNEGSTPLVLYVASMTDRGKHMNIDEPRPGNCAF